MKRVLINITDLVRNQCAYSALIQQVEPVFLIELLRHTGGNKSEAARIAGIHRDTLTRKLKQHGIKIELQVKDSQGERLLPPISNTGVSCELL